MRRSFSPKWRLVGLITKLVAAKGTTSPRAKSRPVYRPAALRLTKRVLGGARYVFELRIIRRHLDHGRKLPIVTSQKVIDFTLDITTSLRNMESHARRNARMVEMANGVLICVKRRRRLGGLSGIGIQSVGRIRRENSARATATSAEQSSLINEFQAWKLVTRMTVAFFNHHVTKDITRRLVRYQRWFILIIYWMRIVVGRNGARPMASFRNSPRFRIFSFFFTSRWRRRVNFPDAFFRFLT